MSIERCPQRLRNQSETVEGSAFCKKRDSFSDGIQFYCYCELVTDITGVAISFVWRGFLRQYMHWLGMTVKGKPFRICWPFREKI